MSNQVNGQGNSVMVHLIGNNNGVVSGGTDHTDNREAICMRGKTLS